MGLPLTSLPLATWLIRVLTPRKAATSVLARPGSIFICSTVLILYLYLYLSFYFPCTYVVPRMRFAIFPCNSLSYNYFLAVSRSADGAKGGA